MKDPSDYYGYFEEGLAKRDTGLAEEFRSIIETKSPKHVFLWLEDLRLKGILPKELEPSLTDFYSLFF